MDLRINKILIFFFFLGSVIPTLSFSDYVEVPYERELFKAIGFGLIILAALTLFSLRSLKLFRDEQAIILPILGLYTVLAISASMYDFSSSLRPWARLLAVLFICLFLSNLTKEELLYLVKLFLGLGFFLALIAIIQALMGLQGGGEFPLLNLWSNKSVIFEQNVFGIYIYMCLIIACFSNMNLQIKHRRMFLASYLFGVFISFYRTVYALILLRISLRYPFLSFLVFIIIGSCLFMTDILSLVPQVLEFGQLRTLSRRTELWDIGLVSFFQSPLLGSGENAIPEFSNQFLYGHPPFTTYHNVLIDILASGGILTMIFFAASHLFIVLLIRKKDIFTFLFLMAPSLSNTYYIFAPNLLGVFLGAYVIYSVKLSREAETRNFAGVCRELN